MSHPVVFLMPDNPVRAALWTPQAQALAKTLDLDVRLADEPLSPDSVKGAEAIITSWGAPRIDQAYLDAAPDLKLVGHAAGSVKAIVSPELFQCGIPVVSANAEMAKGVAQWSLMMTMIAARRMLTSSNFGTHKAMEFPPPIHPTGLHDLTVGIWGYGAITRELIRLLRAAGVERILIASEYLKKADAEKDQLIPVELPELFEQSDVLHLLTSLNAKRVGRVDADLLSRLADGATLINTGRAHLVDESAMMNELSSGRLNACLDVYHQEPLPEDHPLRALSNVVLTPHSAGKGTRTRYVPLVLNEIDRCLKGLPLQHEVTSSYAAAMTTEYKQMI